MTEQSTSDPTPPAAEAADLSPSQPSPQLPGNSDGASRNRADLPWEPCELDWAHPPVLRDPTGERATTDLLLREHRLSDVQGIYERCIDPASVAWTVVPREYTEAMAQEYAERVMGGSPGVWSWALEFQGRYAGTVDARFSGLSLPDAQEAALKLAEAEGFGLPRPQRSAGLGFVLHQNQRGQGLMGQAVRLVADRLFGQDLVDVLTWQAIAGNIASWKSAEAAGFPPYLEIPALLQERGVTVDGWYSALNRSAWEASRAR